MQLFRLAVPAVFVALFAPLSATPANAEETLEPIRIAYRAPAACPSADDFVAEVRRAVPRLRLTYDDPKARLFTVMLDETRGHTGRLAVTKDGAVMGAREVTGTSCAEVMAVLAFATALAVDPNAVPPPPLPPPPPPTSPTADSAPPSPGPLPPAPASAVAAPKEPSAPPSPRPPLGEPPRSAPPDVPHEPLSFAFYVGGVAGGGVAPEPMLGGTVGADLRGRLGPLRPALRLAIEYATSSSVSNDGADVTFARAIGVVEPCPTAWLVSRITLEACARAEFGARLVAAQSIPGGRSVSQPWLGLGGKLQARVRVVGPVFVEAGGGIVFALFRDTALLATETTPLVVHENPLVGALGEIATGLEFP